MEEKVKKLKEIIKKMESVLVAFSGGVDSTFLLKFAKDTLKEKVMAVTAVSPTYPEEELNEAKKIARMLGVKHILVETKELENPEFTRNSPWRCYWCKRELFSVLNKIAQANNIKQVIDASNWDDLKDFRPGMQAAREMGINSPLKEAGLTKAEIRILSKKMGLPTWNKPSLACLSSRIPYGMKIKREDVEKIAKGESFLKKLGFHQVRVRHYKDTARIEVLPEEIPRLLKNENREKIVKKFKNLGYIYVTIDLEGYRSGSMNEVLGKINHPLQETNLN